MPAPRFVVSTSGRPGGRVAVAALPDGGVLVRDDQREGGTVLTFTAPEWTAFVAGVKNGEFDVG